MPTQTKVALVSDVAPGTSRVIETGAGPVALYNVEGRIYATSNTCVHAGGPLGEGSLSGPTITCPWHGWSYDVTTGQCKTNPRAKVKSFPVEIKDGEVYLSL
jgi:nitrite reductase/ring-hydroxylating ferredoxin subunit